MTFQEIKELDKDLDDLESCEGFYTYLKSLAEKKAINIIEKEQNLCIKFTIKHIIKNNTIELILSSEAKNTDELFKDLYKKIKDLESKDKIINELKTNNDKLNKEIQILKEEIKEVKALIEPMKRFKEININRYKNLMKNQ